MRGIFGVYLSALRSLSDGQAAECLLDSSGRLLTATSFASSSGTRVEGTIASGGTAQLAFSATPASGWEIINPHQTETLFVRENGTATAAYNAASMPVLPGGSYTTPVGYQPAGDVSVIAATTGHTFIARRW